MSHQLDNISAGTQVVSLVEVPVLDEMHHERMLAVKRGEVPWADVDTWRKELHHNFERGLAETKLPERPDYEATNEFLVRARRSRAKSI